ncbi:MAG: DJ-1/PfpI family protein [Spirochaetia bacterium]|nr:DJ-1/PfpI family protein [Spirochaetia bacterium]
MDKKVLFLLAEGFEEMEAVIPADLCIRSGIEVVTAGIGGIDITGAHGLSLIADCEIEDVEDEEFDAVVIPGGLPGAENVAECAEAVEIIRTHAEAGKVIAAICAAPSFVLGQKTDILSGRKATCYPGCEGRFSRDVKYTGTKVEQDGNVITGKGPGAAPEFGAAVIRALLGADNAAKVMADTLFAE